MNKYLWFRMDTGEIVVSTRQGQPDEVILVEHPEGLGTEAFYFIGEL